MGEYLTGILTGITITDIIDIALVSVLVYALLGFLKSSRAAQLAKGIVIFVIIAFIASVCKLYVVSWILSSILNIGLVSLVVVFQPELRSALDFLGRTRLGLRPGKINTQKNIDAVTSICDAVSDFSQNKEGALIIIERSTSLTDIANTGTILNADISSGAIENIFYKGAPLHDGAAVIRKDKIFSAGCILPLTANNELSRDLGTRHRAGIGISEVSDAFVIIVSEETGIISVAVNGRLTRFLNTETLKKQLLDIYMGESEKTIISGLAAFWRKLNG